MATLAEFLARAGKRKYRELVQHHMREISVPDLQRTVTSEIGLLPEELRAGVEGYIDTVNLNLGYDSFFWQASDVDSAFDRLMQMAILALDIETWIKTPGDARDPKNDTLAFGLFQIPTLNFAYSAAQDKAQRKFMGIRKGFLR